MMHAPPVSPSPSPSPSRSGVSPRPDIDLFIEQVGWLGARLRDPSRLGLMSWIGRALRPEVRAELRGFFLTDHPVQIRAEAEMLSLLRRPWQKRAPRYRRLDVPERDVDWVRTHLEELTAPPSRYWSREQVPLLDAGLLGALCTLGQTLLDLGDLGRIGEERRATRAELREAIARVSRVLGLRHVPYTSLHEQRLSRIDGDARRSALSIRACLSFWRDTFGADGDMARLRALGERLDEVDLRHGGKTLYSLLELSAAISIARAAEETADAADLPEGVPWEVEDVDERDETNVPRIRLRAGALSCTISKKAPKGDRIVPLLLQMGLSARGNQPDMVLTFARRSPSGQEDQIVVLADAKRNAEHDGKGYLASSVDAAIVYAVSYGHLMGLRFHPEGRQGIEGDVLPAVTLFCRQGVGRVGGVGPQAEGIVARLRNPETLPAIMALDLSHFFHGAEGQAWHSSILSAWFGRVARQASTALRRRAIETRAHEGAGPENRDRGGLAPRAVPAARREK